MPATTRDEIEITTAPSPVKRRSPASPKKGSATASRRRRTRYNASLKIFRRTHMYFGLLLVPFVLLYGVTAILFNHPSWFNSKTSTVAVEPDALGDLATLSAADLAAELLGPIEDEAGVPIRIIEDPPPRLRGTVLVEYREPGLRQRYRVHPETLETTLENRILAMPKEEEEEDEETYAFPSKLDSSASAALDGIVEAVDGLAEQEGGTVRAGPDLEFQIEAEGDLWAMEYDTRSKQLSARRVGEPRSEFDLRSFLLRLHVSRGYPADAGVRTFWGVLVDTTAALMIFWGLSGILMWWQMKPTRFAGGVAMVAGAAIAAGLAVGMFLVIYY